MNTSRGIFVKSPGKKPITVININILVIGGSGGNGGNDSRTPGYPGYPGKQVTGTIEVGLKDLLTISVGGGGSAGRGSTQAGGGAGGVSSSGYGGGAGGGAGYSGSSGGGGGGGAASVVSLNNELLVVAGGGPGGGGAGNGPQGMPTQGYQSSGLTSGGNGANKSGDGGGGGGGGGGNLGGAGGALRSGDSGAYSGSYGASTYPVGFTETTTTNDPGAAGRVTVTYTSPTGEAYFTGGRVITLKSSVDSSAVITHVFEDSGVLTGKGGSIAQDVVWREVLDPSVKVNGNWEQITTVHTMVNGEWKKVFPSSGTVEYTSPGVYNWTVPAGIHSITYTMVAGGGAGGGYPYVAPTNDYYYNSGDAGGWSPDSSTPSDGGGGGGGGGGDCFVSNALVTMADGTTKQIIDVAIGEYVYNHDRSAINRVMFIERVLDTNWETLYTPTAAIEPFATINHPLYIDGKLSSPNASDYNYPWLGTMQKITPAKVVPTNGQVVYNLWVDGDGTYIINGYGTTSIVGDGGLIRHMADQGIITPEEVQNIIDLVGQNTKRTSSIEYGAYLINYWLGIANIKLINRIMGVLLKHNTTRAVVFAVCKAVGKLAYIRKNRL